MRVLDETGNPVYLGKFRGIVMDNNDPDKLGRLKLKVPEILGEVITTWAYPALPYGGFADTGIFFIPEVGSGTYVEFESGDVNRPIWTGVWWAKPSSSEVPAKAATGAYPQIKLIRTRAGHHIKWDDATGEIEIASPDNSTYYRIKDDSIIINSTATIAETSATAKTETVGTNKTETITGNKTETIGGNKIAIITGTETETVTGTSTEICVATKTINGAIAVNIVSAGIVTLAAPSVIIGAAAGGAPVLTGTAMDIFNSHTHGGSPGPSPQMVPGVDSTLITKAL